MIYGYARVSTSGQAKDGNSLENQRKKLLNAGATEIVEENFTGTTTNRPAFSKLIERLKSGDTLVVTKLDRFARTAGQGAELIKQLIEKEISVHVLNMGLIDNRPANKLMITMMLAFAEFERDMIVERTQEGKRIAKQKANFREGRPRISKKQTDHALSLLDSGMSYKQVSEVTGISKSTLIRRRREKRLLFVK